PSELASIDEALVVRGRQVQLAEPCELDAGAVGKGIAVDSIIEFLRSRGVTTAYVDFGGSSIATIGPEPGCPPWRVAVAAGQRIAGFAEAQDVALSTSQARPAGVGTGTIINPRTGAPVEASRSATVRAPTATAAEAWSTALVVLGRRGLAALHARGYEGVLVEGSQIFVTPGGWFTPAGPE
ncbi:MAG: FAD:protein FMN transferase, partial [Candidatus Dadabacteria bacterium]